MRMGRHSFVLLVALLLSLPAASQAQDFGVMESAETIDRGNFKFKVNPMFLFGKDLDDEAGVTFLTGYGFTDNFDLEGGVAVYDGFRLFGGNAEVWLVKNQTVDVSASAGLHFGRGDRTPDIFGVGFTFLASGHLTPRFELYTALDLGFDEITEPGDDSSFKTVHLVPGFEFRVTQNLDLVAELGLGLSDDARHYFSGGLAFYFR